MSNLNELIKKIALLAIEEQKPTAIEFGTVENVSPLRIRIDQKKVLSETFLTLTNNVKDHTETITLNGISQECIIHKNLQLNEKVILIRYSKGQKYLVLDRM